MARLRDLRTWWPGVVATALVASPAFARAADNEKKAVEVASAAAAKQEKDKAEARAIRKDLMDLFGSLGREDSAAKVGKSESENDAAVLAKAGRPGRVVQKTSFDAAQIDALLAKTLKDAKVSPAEKTGDEEFIRRVTLDVTGKLPTPQQVIQFRKSGDKHKRAELIDSLLNTEDYARNWARYFRDVVSYHATNENRGLVRFNKMEDWLTEQFARNRPWDEIATEMIAGNGDTAENGAPVLISAHMGQAVELAGEVSRVFLGVQIQCAQCHDHPSDQWKREQFHEFAAFFGGIVARNNRMGDNGPGYLVSDRKGVPAYKMPDLKDPTKQIPIAPKFFLSEAKDSIPSNLTSSQRRILAASYITGQDNPWFAKAFVNRAWASLMGEGFYNPVDDMGPTRTARAPEVIDALAAEWQKGGYDVRWLFRTILNSNAYQRQFKASNTSAGKTPFAANCPSRLRADQLVDALSHALNINFTNNVPVAKNGTPKGGAKADAKAVAQAGKLNGGPRLALNLLFGVDPSVPIEDVMGTIPQALFMMNSPQVNRAISGNKGTILAEIFENTPNERAALEALYLRVLARSPSNDEVRTCGHYIERVGNRREAFEDILWALVNSTEFLSRK